MKENLPSYLSQPHPKTNADWARFYADRFNELPELKRKSVVAFVKNNLSTALNKEDLDYVKNLILKSPVPDAWKDEILFFHHGGGMSFRNWLRANEFGEEYLEIWNLDDYYIPILEKAFSELYNVQFMWQKLL